MRITTSAAFVAHNLDEKSGDQDENCRSPSVVMIAAGAMARKRHLRAWD
jgi:hypothetical protein